MKNTRKQHTVVSQSADSIDAKEKYRIQRIESPHTKMKRKKKKKKEDEKERTKDEETKYFRRDIRCVCVCNMK